MVRFRPQNRPTIHQGRPPRELWRLVMLGVALVLVVSMMLQLRQPETAAKIERVLAGAETVAVEADESSRVITASPDAPQIVNVDRADVESEAGSAALRNMLALAGWDAARLAAFGDGRPLTDAQREKLLDLTRRLKSIDAAELFAWARDSVPAANVISQPAEHRGQLVRLSGRVRGIQRRTLPPDIAARLEIPAYIECELTLDDNAGVATIITARVPQAWIEMEPLDEPAAASGLFVKTIPTDRDQHRAAGLFVSPEIAWHPRREREPFVPFGKTVLGTLGMDVGLLDGVQQRRAILDMEREAFYQTLDAAGRAGANQLIRFANQNLDSVRELWAAEEERLSALADETPLPLSRSEQQRRRLGSEVRERAADRRYSVAPLFNDPENQVGRLAAFDGIARRAVRVDVGRSRDGTPSDVLRRFGIAHYYEMDVFTDDSQNNPLVFCVRELPPGFPTGEAIREPVRVAGFFFKTWSFQSRRGGSAEPGAATNASTRRFAPLIIGRGPIWLQTQQPTPNAFAGWIAGTAFVLLMAAIWAAGWWYARADRRFHERALAGRFTLPDGESLDQLDLESDSNPENPRVSRHM